MEGQGEYEGKVMRGSRTGARREEGGRADREGQREQSGRRRSQVMIVLVTARARGCWRKELSACWSTGNA
eukprot:763735-Hanusia_phi.AAC.5